MQNIKRAFEMTIIIEETGNLKPVLLSSGFQHLLSSVGVLCYAF